jgi:hypothetical protein
MTKRNLESFQEQGIVFSNNSTQKSDGPTKITKSTSNPRTQGIYISTQMIKRILNILNTFKAEVDCNLEFTQVGIQLFALYSATTACVFIKLRKHLFTEYSVAPDIKPYCVKFNVIAKKLDSLYKFKPKQLSFISTSPDNLVLEGISDAKQPVKFGLTTQDTLLEKLDVSEFKYDFLLRVCAEDLWHTMEAMTTRVSIRMNCQSRSLIFESKDDNSTAEMSLALDEETSAKCSNSTNIRNYKATFLKANLSQLAKSTKLASHVLLGLHPKYPLYATYSLCDDFNSHGVANSEVCMYFSPVVEDSDWL